MGLDGVGSNLFCGNKDQLIRTYEKKYREKTNKGYTEVKMAIGKPNESVKPEIKKKEETKKESNLPKSKLDSSV